MQLGDHQKMLGDIAGMIQRQHEQHRDHQELVRRIANMSRQQQEQLQLTIGRCLSVIGNSIVIIRRCLSVIGNSMLIIGRCLSVIGNSLLRCAMMRQMTRRLWVRLATKYGWLDDEDSDEDGG